MSPVTSVTRLVNYLKFLLKHFLTNEAQLFGNILGYFEKYNFLSKNWRGYFLQIWATFIVTSGHTGCLPPFQHFPNESRRREATDAELEFEIKKLKLNW